jgi:outer membrane PBP1 activator LpoA protein
MRYFSTRPGRHLLTSGLAVVLLGLWGCASAPEPAPEPVKPPPVVQPPPPAKSAVETLPPSTYSAQFLAAENLLADFNWMGASEVLATVGPDGLTSDDRVYVGYLNARIAYLQGHQDTALAELAQFNAPGIHPALKYRILNLQRHIVETSGNYLQGARLGDQLLRMAPADDAPAISRGIWRNLQRVDTDRLREAQLSAQDSQWRGWLELAVLIRAGLGQSTRDLGTWLQNNPQHPAAGSPPGGLGYLLGQPPRVTTVALLLPVSGRLAPAGKAVRDGYLASYYAARDTGDAMFEVLVLDLDSYESASAAYDAAIAAGANMIVGPLSKAAVAELNGRADRIVPVLALNRLEGAEPPIAGSTALVQFALAPEDEASTIADLAFGQGARNALVLRPEGSRGTKLADALESRWRELGGTVANTIIYGSREEYSADVKIALDIPASEARAREIERMLATNVEFNARRRQDLDVIFLLSGNGAEARSIKPLLAFHYAGNLPVYATSSIYNGRPDPKNRDLDGINFAEIPWLLGSSPDLRDTVAAGTADSVTYTRLNALGADALLLQLRFLQLQAGPDALLRGNTGLLSMDPNLQIRRELSLATFDGGVVQPQ